VERVDKNITVVVVSGATADDLDKDPFIELRTPEYP
jgi:hypothetical protein